MLTKVIFLIFFSKSYRNVLYHLIKLETQPITHTFVTAAEGEATFICTGAHYHFPQIMFCLQQQLWNITIHFWPSFPERVCVLIQNTSKYKTRVREEVKLAVYDCIYRMLWMKRNLFSRKNPSNIKCFIRKLCVCGVCVWLLGSYKVTRGFFFSIFYKMHG